MAGTETENMRKVLELFVVLCVLLTTADTFCPNPEGESVPWWILYQQKERPFFHYYVDSTSTKRIKEHYPEKPDSVLSRVISAIINDQNAEYIVYSSDLINAKNIAQDRGVPMYSKWMHGVIGTTDSWNTGFWLLHNNLLFPALKDGILSTPGSKSWMLTTIGDNMADLFYACLTADTRKEMEDILLSVMAGNPFVYNKRVHTDSFIGNYLKEVQPLPTSFGLHWSALIFLNCMYSSTNNASHHCLFKYSSKVGMKISVFTRPRGMIKHDSHFCYNERKTSLYDFVQLEKTSAVIQDWKHSMFALSGQTGSNLAGITCFGQDVAANTETVAVMICANIPKIYTNMLKSSRISQWACPKNNKRKESQSGERALFKFPVIQDTHDSPLTFDSEYGDDENNVSDPENTDTITEASNDKDEKGVAKFCLVNDCQRTFSREKVVENGNDNWLKNPLLKNKKLSQWFIDMVSDIKMDEYVDKPTKSYKKKRGKNKPIKARGSADFNKYLINNENGVLALFCRDGCRFCQNAKEEFLILGRSLGTDYLDVILVDVGDDSLPHFLKVQWTPYVRYKSRGIPGEWTDYTDDDFDIQRILEFLKRVTTAAKRSTEVWNNTETSPEPKGNDAVQTSRRRRDTRISDFPFSRQRRDVTDIFKIKHVWVIPNEVNMIDKNAAIDHFNEVAHSDRLGDELLRLIREYPSNAGKHDMILVEKKMQKCLDFQKRELHTFLATRNEQFTLQKLDELAEMNYNQYRQATYDKEIKKNYVYLFRGHPITTQEIEAELIQLFRKGVSQPFTCKKGPGTFRVGVIIVNNKPHINHFGSSNSDFMKNC